MLNIYRQKSLLIYFVSRLVTTNCLRWISATNTWTANPLRYHLALLVTFRSIEANSALRESRLSLLSWFEVVDAHPLFDLIQGNFDLTKLKTSTKRNIFATNAVAAAAKSQYIKYSRRKVPMNQLHHFFKKRNF